MGQGSGRIVAGMDVHKRSTRIAAVEGDRLVGEVTVASDPLVVEGALRRLGVVACCYEAGPTGYGLYRYLNERGLVCEVIAPGLVWRQPGDRIKTDPRDARRLAAQYAGGMLRAIHVLSPEQEALRDLVRAREDARHDRMRARGRLGKFLLRQARVMPTQSWSIQRRAWLGQQVFEEPAAQAAFDDYLISVDLVDRRIDALERGLAEQALEGPYAELVARLRCLRGIDTLSAVGLAAEIGDFERFASAEAFMSFVGLVPTEHSSGAKRTQGSITKAGNATPAAYLSRRPGITAAAQAPATPSNAAAATSTHSPSRERRAPSSASTSAGAGYAAAAKTNAQSSSRSPASWPASSGQPPPTNHSNQPPKPQRVLASGGWTTEEHPRRFHAAPATTTRVLRQRQPRRFPVLRYPTRACQSDPPSLSPPAADQNPTQPLTSNSMSEALTESACVVGGLEASANRSRLEDPVICSREAPGFARLLEQAQGRRRSAGRAPNSLARTTAAPDRQSGGDSRPPNATLIL
jgi:transposase